MVRCFVGTSINISGSTVRALLSTRRMRYRCAEEGIRRYDVRIITAPSIVLENARFGIETMISSASIGV